MSLCVGRAVADGSLKPVGPTLPAPATVLWDATHSRAALSYAQRVDIFAVVSGVDASSKRPSKLRSTPTLQLLSSVTISFASSGVWYRNSLFVCNRSGVFAIFPRLLPSESQPQLSGALGLSSSVVIQLASVHPQPATFGVEPYVTNLPCSVVLGVRGGSVMLATPTLRISGNGAPPVKVLCVPLSSPSIKSLLCIMAGAPASAAVHWAAALPPECQSPFAVSVAVRVTV